MRVRLTRREKTRRLYDLMIPPISLLLALASFLVILLAMGMDIGLAVAALYDVFFSVIGLQDAVIRAIPMMLIAAGLCLAFKMKFWNIGGEGQLYMGAFAAAGVIYLLSLPSWAYLPVMIVASLVAGALWGIIPALLKAKLEVNEVLTTLMLNYIAMYWINYLVYNPWKDPKGYGFPLTPEFPSYATLPQILGSRIHTGVIYAVVASFIIYFVMNRTTLGYETKALGDNPKAALYGGINKVKVTLAVMAISGGLSGLAGLTIVSGMLRRLRPQFSPGYGFSAVIIALLSELNPLASIITSIFFGGLLVVGDRLQIKLGVPSAGVLIFQALALIFFIIGNVAKEYKVSVVLRRR